MCVRRQFLLLILAFLTLQGVNSEEYVVTIQTATQGDMATLADIVDASGGDFTIGAIEGTMTRIKSMGSDYQPATVEVAPTLNLINSATFNTETQQWTFEYETLKSDPSDELQDFRRILYFTNKLHSIDAGDSGNICLDMNQGVSECLDSLRDDYIVLDNLNGGVTDFSSEYIHGTKDVDSDGTPEIEVSKTDHADAITQTLQISFPHKTVTDIIGVALSMADSDDENSINVGYKIGIGMLFVAPDGTALTPLTLFDEFHLLEQNVAEAAITKINQYSLARHVQFYLAQAQMSAFTTVKLVKMEFQIEPGHQLPPQSMSTNPIRVSFNGIEMSLTTGKCDPAGAFVDLVAQANEQCSSPVTTIPLCSPEPYAGNPNVISLVVPLPDSITDAVSSFNLETSLETIESPADGTSIDTDQIPLLSILNIHAQNSFVAVCKDSVEQQFDTIDYVKLEIFNKEQDDTLALMDITSDGASTITFSTIQSLLLAVVRPDDTTAAQHFFTNYDKSINIDDAYMTHTLDENLLTDLSNPTAIRDATGRSTLVIDGTYYETCPLEVHELSVDNKDCITTHDYNQGGPKNRPVTNGNYMYKMSYFGAVNLDELNDGDAITVQTGLKFYAYYSDPADEAVNMVLTVGNPPVETDVEETISLSNDLQRAEMKFNSVQEATLTLTVDGAAKIITINMDDEAALQDKEWLQNIFGPNENARNAYMERVFATVERPKHACMYWMWPIYDWPRNPIGLVDTTRIHLAWSVTDTPAEAASPPYASARRLLGSNELTHVLRRVPHPYKPFATDKRHYLKARRSVESKRRRAQLRRYIEHKLASSQVLKV